VLPRAHYQFIVLSVARATGAAFEWQDHVQHALAAGLPQNIIDGIAEVAAASLPHPYGLLREILSKTLAWQPIPDALQAQAAAEWGKDGLVEIVVVSAAPKAKASAGRIWRCSTIRRPVARATLSTMN
jgi:4-carboxymuconolactone decarboxylase